MPEPTGSAWHIYRGTNVPRADRAAPSLGEAPPWVRDELRDPGYSTVLGLLNSALSTNQAPSSASR